MSNDRLREISQLTIFMTDEEKNTELGTLPKTKYVELKKALSVRADEKREKDTLLQKENKRITSVSPVMSFMTEIERQMSLGLLSDDEFEALKNDLNSRKITADKKAAEEQKKAAKIKADSDKIAAEKKEQEQKDKDALLAPDKDKLGQLAKDIYDIKRPEVESPEAKKLVSDTFEMLAKTINYIQANKIKL